MKFASPRNSISSLLAILGWGGARVPPEVTTASTFRAWVLDHVPLGTASTDARRFFKDRNFQCQLVRDGAFTPDAPAGAGTWTHQNYVYCDGRQRLRLMLARRWQVALVEEAGRIVEVGVSVGLLGL